MDTVHVIVVLRSIKLPAIELARLLRVFTRCYVLCLAIYIKHCCDAVSQFQITHTSVQNLARSDFASNTVMGQRSRVVIAALAY